MDIDRDLPYDLEDHAVLAADDSPAIPVVDPLRAVSACDPPDGCGAAAGEIHWPACPVLLGDDPEDVHDRDDDQESER